MQAVTEWFDGDEKPVHGGPYERKVSGTALDIYHPPTPIYSYWNDIWWSIGDKTPDLAMLASHLPSEYQNLPWRGVAK